MNKPPALHNVGTGDLVAELNNRGYSPEDAKAEQIISFVARRFDIDRAERKASLGVFDAQMHESDMGRDKPYSRIW
jgi:hypothetical protein